MVFQTRKQDIRVASFVAAFQSMLRTIDDNKQWRIEPLTGKVPFQEWQKTVAKISRIRFKIEGTAGLPPNGTGLVALISQCHTDLAALELRARAGIDVEGSLVREILRQSAAGHGELVAVGRQEEGATSERAWVSTLGGESVVTEVQVDRDTGPASFESLQAELAKITPRSQ